ncbi:DotA/TraY family protein [Delftia lacustris]
MKKAWIMFLAMLLPSLALADGPFTPVADDISVKVLGQIFGSLVTIGGNDAFGSAISTFNGAVLIVGGILATYTILAGTLGTAHDGEMLGKKFSSVWIPIRYSLGTALVVPVLSGGYCIMQQMVMWLVLQGVGLADVVWDAYMQTPGVSANLSINKNTEDKVRLLAENVFMAQVCVEANKQAVEETDSVLTIKSRYNYARAYDEKNRTYNFGDQKGLISGWSKNDCGEVTFGEKIENSTVADGPASTNRGYLGPLDGLFQPTDIQLINKAHEAATAGMIVLAEKAAQELVKEGDNMDVEAAGKFYTKAVKVATMEYLAGVKTAANIVAMTPSDTTKSAHKYGWFMAGAYFMNTVVTNNKITNALAAVPDSKFSKSAFNDQAEALQATGLKVVAAGNPDYGSAANAINAKKDTEASKATQELGFSGRIMNALTRGLTSIDLYELKNDTRHPVIVINEMGSRLQAFWTGMIITLIGVTGAAGIAALFPSASAIATTVSNVLLILVGFLGLPIMALAATAFTASYLIPMLPFMMWLGILGGWLIAVVISVIAAPLWAIMHLHPSGDDLTGRGGNGYMMVLGLLLRPCLAIFGFIAAVVISSVMGEFINKVFFQVFSFSQGDGKGLGFFIGMIAGTAIYVGIMFSFIKKTFGLMHVIPDELMKWIGGGGDQLGHYAGKMGEGSQGAVGAVAAFTAGRGLSQGMQNSGRQLADIGKQHKAAKENKATEAKNKQFQGLKNNKEFDDFKGKLDENFGPGTGEEIASFMGINADNIDSFESQEKMHALGGAIAAVKPHGGEAGAAFIESMQEQSADGFAAYGGAKEAAGEISQGIVTNSLLAKAGEDFGGGASDYLHTVAGNGSGGIDNGKAQRAMNDLGKAKAALGGQFQSVFDQAVSQHPDSGSAMTAHIARAYQQAGSSEEGTARAAAPQAEAGPVVPESFVFNPATNQVEGDPNQGSFDFEANNPAQTKKKDEPPQFPDGDRNDV